MLEISMMAGRALGHLNDPDLLHSQPFIDGQGQHSSSGTQVTDPARGDEIARVGDCNVAMIDQAINAADSAFKVWR